MKARFFKWQVSNALDAGTPPWAWLRHWAGRSKDLRTVEPDMIALDRELRQSVPGTEAPPWLHQSIMGAIRAADAPQPVRRMPSVWRWLPAPALLTAALLMVWFSLHRSARPSPASTAEGLDAAATALVTGGQLAQDAPAAAVAPLSDELARLNQDLQNTAQFLLANIP